MSGTAALPRSSLHLAFLAANEPGVSHVLYRDQRLRGEIERLFPGRGVDLGREKRPTLRPWATARRFSANRRYYREVQAKLLELRPQRLILFLEGEPLERMLTTWFDGPIELWEDGLSHYLDLTGAIWYAARGAIQALSGYYPRGALGRRADRSAMIVRDRFHAHNLLLPSPALAPARARFLLVGSPLAEDGLVSREEMRRGVERIASVAPAPVLYLPHPREDRGAATSMLAGIGNAALAPDPWGLTSHVEAHGYAGFLAPVSTGLLDLQAFERSLFVPLLFGQRRMHRVLSRWAANPIAVAADEGAVARFFGRALADRVAQK